MYSVDQEPNEEEKQEKLSQDYSPPFSPPDGQKDSIPEDDPRLDTNADAQEWYDAGRTAAAGGDDKRSDPGILGYNPKAKKPKN